MKTYLNIRLIVAVLATAITVSCEPLFNDVYFPKEEEITTQNVSRLDSVPSVLIDSTEYFLSDDIYYPLDTGRIERWEYIQNVEGILIFQGWYNQIENNDPSTVKQKTSKLVLFFSTEVQPGTYDIIPIPSFWQDWVYVDILTVNTYRYLLPAGKCIGYFTVGTDVPTNEWFFSDPDYMSRLKEFNSGQLKFEKEDQMFSVEIQGKDESNTEVKLFYKGTLTIRAISWAGTVVPDFWLPHHTNGI